MNNFLPTVKKIITISGDLGLMYLALFLTLIIRYRQSPTAEIWQNHWTVFSGLFILWLIIFYAFSLFQQQLTRQKLDLIKSYIPAILLALVSGVGYFYLIETKSNLTPKTSLLILIIIFSGLFFIFNLLLTKIFETENLYRKIILIGYHPLIKELLPATGQKRFEFIYKGLISDSDKPADWPNDIRVYSLNQLEAVIKQEKIELIIISSDDNKEVVDALFKILHLKVSFMSLKNFYEWVFKRVPLNIIDRGWFLNNFSEGDKKIFNLVKRTGDILLAIIFLIIALPIMPLIGAAIALTSKGPVFFKQTRSGYGGKPFLLYKFRTMFQNAEKNGAVWAEMNDPRITVVGKFLRQTRLDEIPQLLNILKGEMSFVGPRPERPEFVADLTQKIPFYQERLLVKPGLTGWAQILGPAYGGNVEESLEKLQYDLFYVKHRDIFLDWAIIIKTLSIVTKMIGR